MVVVRGLWKTKTDRISMQISLLMSGLTPCCFQETGHPDTECQEEEDDGQVRKTAHLGILHHQVQAADRLHYLIKPRGNGY